MIQGFTEILEGKVFEDPVKRMPAFMVDLLSVFGDWGYFIAAFLGIKQVTAS